MCLIGLLLDIKNKRTLNSLIYQPMSGLYILIGKGDNRHRYFNKRCANAILNLTCLVN